MIGNARLLGWLEEEQLLALFRRSAVYLSTALYEPFGLAPLEAALCGCAVVAYDIPSLREVWGDAALFFENAASLQVLLARLAERPEELAAAQNRSSLRARQLTADRMVDAYLALFRQALLGREALTHVA
jgi:glycosyltransferase involved in cell wall biosynthesis